MFVVKISAKKKKERENSLQRSQQTSENMETFPVERVANTCVLTLPVAAVITFDWLAFAVLVYKDGEGRTRELHRNSTSFEPSRRF